MSEQEFTFERGSVSKEKADGDYKTPKGQSASQFDVLTPDSKATSPLNVRKQEEKRVKEKTRQVLLGLGRNKRTSGSSAGTSGSNTSDLTNRSSEMGTGKLVKLRVANPSISSENMLKTALGNGSSKSVVKVDGESGSELKLGEAFKSNTGNASEKKEDSDGNVLNSEDTTSRSKRVSENDFRYLSKHLSEMPGSWVPEPKAQFDQEDQQFNDVNGEKYNDIMKSLNSSPTSVLERDATYESLQGELEAVQGGSSDPEEDRVAEKKPETIYESSELKANSRKSLVESQVPKVPDETPNGRASLKNALESVLTNALGWRKSEQAAGSGKEHDNSNLAMKSLQEEDGKRTPDSRSRRITARFSNGDDVTATGTAVRQSIVSSSSSSVGIVSPAPAQLNFGSEKTGVDSDYEIVEEPEPTRDRGSVAPTTGSKRFTNPLFSVLNGSKGSQAVSERGILAEESKDSLAEQDTRDDSYTGDIKLEQGSELSSVSSLGSSLDSPKAEYRVSHGDGSVSSFRREQLKQLTGEERDGEKGDVKEDGVKRNVRKVSDLNAGGRINENSSGFSQQSQATDIYSSSQVHKQSVQQNGEGIQERAKGIQENTQENFPSIAQSTPKKIEHPNSSTISIPQSFVSANSSKHSLGGAAHVVSVSSNTYSARGPTHNQAQLAESLTRSSRLASATSLNVKVRKPKQVEHITASFASSGEVSSIASKAAVDDILRSGNSQMLASENRQWSQSKETTGQPDMFDPDDASALFVTATYPFDASTLESKNDASICLSFDQGDIAFTYNLDESGWGEVILVESLQRGWVPMNYFKSAVVDTLQEAEGRTRNERLANSKIPLRVLFRNAGKFLLNPQSKPFYLAGHLRGYVFDVECFNGITDGIRKLLIDTDCISRSNTIVQRKPTLRRLRKKLLRSWSDLIAKAKGYMHTMDPAKIELLQLLTFDVLKRAITFLDVWGAETADLDLEQSDEQKSRLELSTFTFDLSFLGSPPSAEARAAQIYDQLVSYLALIAGRIDLVEHNIQGCRVLETVVGQVNLLANEAVFSMKLIKDRVEDQILGEDMNDEVHDPPKKSLLGRIPLSQLRSLDSDASRLQQTVDELNSFVRVMIDVATRRKIAKNLPHGSNGGSSSRNVSRNPSRTASRTASRNPSRNPSTIASRNPSRTASRSAPRNPSRHTSTRHASFSTIPSSPSSPSPYFYSREGGAIVINSCKLIGFITSSYRVVRGIIRQAGDFTLPATRRYPDYDKISLSAREFITRCSAGLMGDSKVRTQVLRYVKESETEVSSPDSLLGTPFPSASKRFSVFRAGNSGDMKISDDGLDFLAGMNWEKGNGDKAATSKDDVDAGGADSADADSDNDADDSDIKNIGTQYLKQSAADVDREIIRSQKNDKQILGASFRALVWMLTDDSNPPDYFYTSTFFLTFRIFANGAMLLEELIRLFGVGGGSIDGKHASAFYTRPIDASAAGYSLHARRKLVCKAFRVWMESYWKPRTDYVLLAPLINFFNEGVKPLLPVEAYQLLLVASKLVGQPPVETMKDKLNYINNIDSDSQLLPRKISPRLHRKQIARVSQLYTNTLAGHRASATHSRAGSVFISQLDAYNSFMDDIDSYGLGKIDNGTTAQAADTSRHQSVSQSIRRSLNLGMHLELNDAGDASTDAAPGSSTLLNVRQTTLIKSVVLSYRRMLGRHWPIDADGNDDGDDDDDDADAEAKNRYTSLDTQLLIDSWWKTSQESWKCMNQSLILLNFNGLELAKQLTLIESKMFCSIKVNELLNQNFTTKKLHLSLSPNIQKSILFTNLLSEYVIESILQPDIDIKMRVHAVKLWLKVAISCLYLRNFNSLASIMTSLQSFLLTRIQTIWDGLSAKYQDLFHYLASIIHPDKNYHIYRAKLHDFLSSNLDDDLEVPTVPYLALFLQDLTFVVDGNPNYRSNDKSFLKQKLINIDKYFKITRIISDIQTLQVPYTDTGELGTIYNSPESVELRARAIQCLQHEFSTDTDVNFSYMFDIVGVPCLQELILLEIWKVKQNNAREEDRAWKLSCKIQPRSKHETQSTGADYQTLTSLHAAEEPSSDT